MDIQITTRHDIKATASTKEMINKKLSKLDKFTEKFTSCHVVLDSESVYKVVEIVMNGRSKTVTALAKEENMGKAIDEAVDKAQRQLRKINTKIKDHKAPKPEIIPEVLPEAG